MSLGDKEASTVHEANTTQFTLRANGEEKIQAKKIDKKLFALEKCSIIIGLELRDFLLSSLGGKREDWGFCRHFSLVGSWFKIQQNQYR